MKKESNDVVESAAEDAIYLLSSSSEASQRKSLILDSPPLGLNLNPPQRQSLVMARLALAELSYSTSRGVLSYISAEDVDFISVVMEAEKQKGDTPHQHLHLSLRNRQLEKVPEPWMEMVSEHLS
jgi:hypothetical protein